CPVQHRLAVRPARGGPPAAARLPAALGGPRGRRLPARQPVQVSRARAAPAAARGSGLAPPRCPRAAGSRSLTPPDNPRCNPPLFLRLCPPRSRSHAPSFCDESLFGAKPPGPARAAPRIRKEDVAKLHSLLWSPPPAPQNQPGLSPHRRGTPLRAVHPPASSEPGHEEKSCGWRHPGSHACSKGCGAPARARSQSVSRLSTPPDRTHLSSNLGSERWKNRSTPTTPAAPQGSLVRGRSNSVSGSPVPKNAKAAGGCTARPPWK
uniref:RBPJ-interacting and tubulin-associated protein 1 n=1 Tax=Taeniopygia guttata TaxID=59729 RepID=A0A674H7Z2_TAEGU